MDNTLILVIILILLILTVLYILNKNIQDARRSREKLRRQMEADAIALGNVPPEQGTNNSMTDTGESQQNNSKPNFTKSRSIGQFGIRSFLQRDIIAQSIVPPLLSRNSFTNIPTTTMSLGELKHDINVQKQKFYAVDKNQNRSRATRVMHKSQKMINKNIIKPIQHARNSINEKMNDVKIQNNLKQEGILILPQSGEKVRWSISREGSPSGSGSPIGQDRNSQSNRVIKWQKLSTTGTRTSGNGRTTQSTQQAPENQFNTNVSRLSDNTQSQTQSNTNTNLQRLTQNSSVVPDSRYTEQLSENFTIREGQAVSGANTILDDDLQYDESSEGTILLADLPRLSQKNIIKAIMERQRSSNTTNISNNTINTQNTIITQNQNQNNTPQSPNATARSSSHSRPPSGTLISSAFNLAHPITGRFTAVISEVTSSTGLSRLSQLKEKVMRSSGSGGVGGVNGTCVTGGGSPSRSIMGRGNTSQTKANLNLNSNANQSQNCSLKEVFTEDQTDNLKSNDNSGKEKTTKGRSNSYKTMNLLNDINRQLSKNFPTDDESGDLGPDSNTKEENKNEDAKLNEEAAAVETDNSIVKISLLPQGNDLNWVPKCYSIASVVEIWDCKEGSWLLGEIIEITYGKSRLEIDQMYSEWETQKYGPEIQTAVVEDQDLDVDDITDQIVREMSWEEDEVDGLNQSYEEEETEEDSDPDEIQIEINELEGFDSDQDQDLEEEEDDDDLDLDRYITVLETIFEGDETQCISTKNSMKLISRQDTLVNLLDDLDNTSDNDGSESESEAVTNQQTVVTFPKELAELQPYNFKGIVQQQESQSQSQSHSDHPQQSQSDESDPRFQTLLEAIRRVTGKSEYNVVIPTSVSTQQGNKILKGIKKMSLQRSRNFELPTNLIQSNTNGEDSESPIAGSPGSSKRNSFKFNLNSNLKLQSDSDNSTLARLREVSNETPVRERSIVNHNEGQHNKDLNYNDLDKKSYSNDTTPVESESESLASSQYGVIQRYGNKNYYLTNQNPKTLLDEHPKNFNDLLYLNTTLVIRLISQPISNDNQEEVILSNVPLELVRPVVRIGEGRIQTATDSKWYGPCKVISRENLMMNFTLKTGPDSDNSTTLLKSIPNSNIRRFYEINDKVYVYLEYWRIRLALELKKVQVQKSKSASAITGSQATNPIDEIDELDGSEMLRRCWHKATVVEVLDEMQIKAEQNLLELVSLNGTNGSSSIPIRSLNRNSKSNLKSKQDVNGKRNGGPYLMSGRKKSVPDLSLPHGPSKIFYVSDETTYDDKHVLPHLIDITSHSGCGTANSNSNSIKGSRGVGLKVKIDIRTLEEESQSVEIVIVPWETPIISVNVAETGMDEKI